MGHPGAGSSPWGRPRRTDLSWHDRHNWGHQMQASLRLNSIKAWLVSQHGRMVLLGTGVASMAAVAQQPSPGKDGSTNGNGNGKGKLDRHKVFTDIGHPARRGTDIVLLVNAACCVLQWLSKDALTFWGAKVNALIRAGQLWRLITPTFLHSSLFHLCVNSFTLNNIGPHVEVVGGHARFGLVYGVAALTGTLASYVFTPSHSVGSSGALFGLGGALALFYWQHRDVLGDQSKSMLRSLGLTASINMVCSLTARNIDSWGHLGGLLGGVLVGWLFGPNMVRDDSSGKFNDQPPVPWLAYPPGTTFSQRPNTRSRQGHANNSSNSGVNSNSDGGGGGASTGAGGGGSASSVTAGGGGSGQQAPSVRRRRRRRVQGEGECEQGGSS